MCHFVRNFCIQILEYLHVFCGEITEKNLDIPSNLDFLGYIYFQNLKDVLANLVPQKQAEVKQLRQEHGKTKVGEVTLDMVSMHPKYTVIHFIHHHKIVEVCYCFRPYVIL